MFCLAWRLYEPWASAKVVVHRDSTISSLEIQGCHVQVCVLACGHASAFKCEMRNAKFKGDLKCEVRSAKCEMRNGRSEMRNAKCEMRTSHVNRRREMRSSHFAFQREAQSAKFAFQRERVSHFAVRTLAVRNSRFEVRTSVTENVAQVRPHRRHRRARRSRSSHLPPISPRVTVACMRGCVTTDQSAVRERRRDVP